MPIAQKTAGYYSSACHKLLHIIIMALPYVIFFYAYPLDNKEKITELLRYILMYNPYLSLLDKPIGLSHKFARCFSIYSKQNTL